MFVESGERRSQVEGLSEFAFREVSFVVDLHLLLAVDLGLDAGLEVLELELGCHASAVIGRVADEACLADGA